MGRLAVRLDAGNELSLKASNLDMACKICAAVFGEDNLILCPTCEAVWICAPCKPQHTCMDQHGRIGVSVVDDSRGRLAISDISPDSPAAKAGLRAGDIIHAIDGIPVTDPNHHPPIRGPIGSHVSLTVLRDGHLVAQALTVTLKRGREPAVRMPAMPGVQILSLLSQGPTACSYKVQMETPEGGKSHIGIMMYDMTTGQGNILMHTDGDGEDPMGFGKTGAAEEALDECYRRAASVMKFAEKRKWNKVLEQEQEIRSIVAKFEETASSLSTKVSILNSQHAVPVPCMRCAVIQA